MLHEALSEALLRRAWVQDHCRERPLVPLGVRHCHDCRHGHPVHGTDVILKIDGGDPLATGLDHVLRAVGDDKGTLLVNHRDVTRDEPTLVELFRGAVLEVFGNDPRPSHKQLARLPLRELHVEIVWVRDAHLHTWKRQPCLGDVLEKLLGRLGKVLVLGHVPAKTAQRVGLRHAPALHELHSEIVCVPGHHLGGRRRPATGEGLELQGAAHPLDAPLLDGSAHSLPHRRNTCAELHLPVCNRVEEALRVHEPAREDGPGT
mmetsp:Transcript_39560/g.91833  ORF Transcript_39560/g.91833 Transcript_39560/m.91833 type:complete len:261 (-) Transcript_39560:105-887(-)